MALSVNELGRESDGTPRMKVAFSWHDWPLCHLAGVELRDVFWKVGVSARLGRWVNRNGHAAPIAYQLEMDSAWRVHEAVNGDEQ